MKTFVSLCASAGGMDLGAMNAGLKPAAAYEIDPVACEVYARLTGHTPNTTDLTALTDDQIYAMPDADIYLGGPPCQEFSQGNVLGSIAGKKNLWETIIRIVSLKCPPVFVFENVKGLTTKRHGGYLAWIKAQFAQMGYTVEHKILDAADYGVPQNRERVFIVGRLDGKAWQWPTPTHSKTGANSLPQWVSWREVLPVGWEVTAKKGDMPKWVTARDSYQPLPQNAMFNVKEGRHDILHRDDTRPFFTVHTDCINRTRIVLDGIVYRADALAMTRMQSLPDIEMGARQIGNAVPPLLAQVVFSAMKNA